MVSRVIDQWRMTGGWLHGARCVASPNFDERPPGEQPQLIVLHNISLPPGCYGGSEVERFFSNCLDHRADPYFGGLMGLRVSAHFMIRRDGEVLQFVAADRRAWHAGVSTWWGRQRCNDFSIGIELEGTDTTPYTRQQYGTLVPLIRCLRQHYPDIAEDAITGHSDIAPGRKTDPGPAFDWDHLRQLLRVRIHEGDDL